MFGRSHRTTSNFQRPQDSSFSSKRLFRLLMSSSSCSPRGSHHFVLKTTYVVIILYINLHFWDQNMTKLVLVFWSNLKLYYPSMLSFYSYLSVSSVQSIVANSLFLFFYRFPCYSLCPSVYVTNSPEGVHIWYTSCLM